MKTLLTSTSLLAGVLAIAACGTSAGTNGDLTGTGSTKQPLEALIPLQGCGEVESYVRERVVADINKYFDDVKKQIEDSPSGCYYGGYAEGDAMAASAGGGTSSSSSGSGGTPPTAPAPNEKASQTSGTNNQVSGVDEADFIKNDGQYIYAVANGAFRIVKAWPAANASFVTKVAITGTPKKLFVEGDRALVYVSVPKPTSTTSSSGSPYDYGQNQECTYGYECIPSGDGTATKILVFDISDRTAPKQIREIDLSGSLLAARRIGTAVHTVVVDAPFDIPGLKFYPESYTCDYQAAQQDPISTKAQTIAAYEQLRAENLALVAKADLKSGLPSVNENGAPAVAACSGYFRPSKAEGRSFTSLVSVDIGGGAPTTATVVSDPGVVYASSTALYMSVPHTQVPGQGWYDSMAAEKQASTVHRFRIGETPSLTGYEASGIVKGRVLNQFALDEHENHLRIATTTGHAPSPDTHSTMSILERQGNALVLTGKVDDIAPSEDIRSVRFDGSRGFIVTFKKTDPLYVFDLGQPTKPYITGELKIPGFSTYMHMMDASHLLTIGYDAADQGDFAWFQGVMLQIFDVSDMKNPTLAHKEVIGTRGSSSEALTNHLAFNYYAPKDLLALPMTICEGGSSNDGIYGDTMTFSGLMVYDATTAGGFKLKGKVAHPISTNSSSPYPAGACSNWWTNASSEVKRSVVMDDFVYSISETRIKVNALSNLSADVAVVPLDN